VAGAYGDGSNIPRVTVDANGRLTSVTTSPVVAVGYVPVGRTVTAGTGLLGGGSLANNITLSLNLASATPQALGTATAGVSTAAARGDHVHPAVDLSDTNETQGALPLGRGGTGDALSPVAGAVVYSTGTKFAVTNPGIAGQVLVSGGTDEPVWVNAGAGTVTSVNASGGTTGLSFTGGPIITSGTLTLGGTLAIASGGTGATTVAAARTALGATAVGVSVFTAFDAAAARAAIGAGTVTSVGGTGTVNGITLTGTVTSSGSLTLGGVLSGVSLTTQVTGTLPIVNGGTNGTATPIAGAVAHGTGTAYAFTSAGIAGQVLLSYGASAPSFGGIDGGTF
jgi:hypothetical protein